MRLFGLGILIASWVVAVPVASSATEDPEALIREGNILRTRGQTARALGLFKRAYDLAQSPRTAAQLGLCEFALQSYLDAMTHFSEALGTHDRWVENNRALLEETASKLKQHLAEIDISGAPAGAAVSIDGRVIGTLPSLTTWALPGRVILIVSAPGYAEQSRRLDVSAGERREERFRLDAIPCRSQSPTTHPWR